MENKLKLVVVGDSFAGKTSLLFAYTRKQFVDNYATTVFDNWAVSINIDHKDYTVNLFDTAGQEDYENLRCLSYPHTDVFLLCFSLVDRKSLEHCRTIWVPEIRKYADSTPIFLVGTKDDLTESSMENDRVSYGEAKRVAAELDCVKFLPCSALTHKGLKRVFDEAFLAAIGVKLEEDPKVTQCCTIL
ncbi:hypothetical protein WR25_09957 [Diploscapter pachys]|uniref:Uncharacterized protein n=1 Tax=Diploscapter pachys TaxID=2018661 RepID=A0A2A2JDY4_9BILA|nr:hypothetical protein WR25_09957 [Diploscapter pachys]